VNQPFRGAGRHYQERLGVSLHQVGHGLASRGQFAAAQLWFERAVKAKNAFHQRVREVSIPITHVLKISFGTGKGAISHQIYAEVLHEVRSPTSGG
jgi:hypothetical protein